MYDRAYLGRVEARRAPPESVSVCVRERERTRDAPEHYAAIGKAQVGTLVGCRRAARPPKRSCASGKSNRVSQSARVGSYLWLIDSCITQLKAQGLRASLLIARPA